MKTFNKGNIIAMAILGVFSLAQGQNLELSQAVSLAMQNNLEIKNQQASLESAAADLAAATADPSTLIIPLTQAQNSVQLQTVQLEQTKLTVLQSLVASYTSLQEAQSAVNLQNNQLTIDNKNLEIAKTKFGSRNATSLDVSQASTTASTSKQTLRDLQAQLPILAAKLESLIGLPAKGSSRANPVVFKTIETPSNLSASLKDSLPTLLQSAQSVDLARLQVSLADNDFTPTATLRDAKTALEAAIRSQSTVEQNAQNSLSDALRVLDNAKENLSNVQENWDNANSSYLVDQTKYKNGLISKVQLDQNALSVQKANQGRQQSIDGYVKAVVALSVASGKNLTGWDISSGGAK